MGRIKRKNWLVSGLLAIAFLLIAGFGFIMMPQKAQVAHAATERVVATLEAIGSGKNA